MEVRPTIDDAGKPQTWNFSNLNPTDLPPESPSQCITQPHFIHLTHHMIHTSALIY